MDVRVPTLGESVPNAMVGRWFKKAGDHVKIDEPLVLLETDKVSVEILAPTAGVLSDIVTTEGTLAEVGAILGHITVAGEAKLVKAEEAALSAPSDISTVSAPPKIIEAGDKTEPQPTNTPVKRTYLAPPTATRLSPPSPPEGAIEDDETRTPMTKMRRTIARRLKEAQNTAAILTTFNEVDMSGIMSLRAKYRDSFEKAHGVKLGFMSFFVSACTDTLREIREVNAQIEANDLIYKNYYNIGVAVGTDKGLVVPVIRDADRLGLGEIEKTIADFGRRARNGALKTEDMVGGTFTITNGGTYGSLLSTPILNAPQSAILGMHKIQERAVAIDGAVEIRPMMYLALSYDHRVIDGKGAVSFLVRVKEVLEDPSRLLLGM